MSEQTKVNNKMIADFVGIHWHENGTVSNYPSVLNMNMGTDTIPDLKFHTSWDWLMHVVDKIEKTKIGEYTHHTVVIKHEYCVVYCCCNSRQDGIVYQTPYGQNPATKIQAVYDAVVAFINWHNSFK